MQTDKSLSIPISSISRTRFCNNPPRLLTVWDLQGAHTFSLLKLDELTIVVIITCHGRTTPMDLVVLSLL